MLVFLYDKEYQLYFYERRKAMDTERTYCVYKHTLPKSFSGKDNDMVYIGITGREPTKRWSNGNGYRKQDYFYNAIQKYGWDNFNHEILYANLTKEEAEQKEIELIKKYQSNDRSFGYNIANGGNTIGTVSQETKDKISQANKGNQYGIGHIVSKDARNRISKAMIGNQRGKGQKMSEEMKHKLAESHKTESFRKKLSEANKGRVVSEETKRKNSEVHIGLGVKKVVCIETGIVYNSVNEATEANMIKGHGHISECCKGKRKTAGGYHWQYI